MLGLFKKKNKQVVIEAERSLSRMDRDIYLIQQWISHLHEKGEEVRDSHFKHVEVTRKDITEINKWLRYLHAHNSEIHKFVRETTNNIVDLKKIYYEMASRLEKLEKGQLRTLERTNQGQIEDKSSQKNDKKDMSEAIIVETERKTYKTEFNGSQLELLNLLYHADRPFSYEEMAKMLGKKKKSVRNLIYELREKKIDVKSKPTGIRKKGFYLDKEEKIKVSGR